MAQLVPFHNTPPELQQEASALARRKAIADALQAQSMQPLKSQMVGDRVVPIGLGEGLAQLGQALFASKAGQSVDTQGRDLAGKYKKGLMDAVMRYTQQSQGIPGMRDPQELEQSADQGTPLPMKQPADPRGAAIQALMSGYEPLEKLGAADYASELKKGEPYTLNRGDTRFEGGKPVAEGQPFTPTRANKSIPADWERHLPPGARKGETPGTFTGKDGDTMQMHFEDGELVRTANINTMPRVTVYPAGTQPVTMDSIVDPLDPTRTKSLRVNARIFTSEQRDKYIASGGKDRTGILGEAPRLPDIGRDAQKLRMALPKARLAVGSVSQGLDRLSAAMNELHDDPGLSRITGTIFGRTPNLTNTATGAQGTLNMITSNIFQSALQAMREASKTGGAVGNVSDREGDKLERTLASLDQAQGTEKFQRELKKAIAQVEHSKALIQAAFDEQYAGIESESPVEASPMSFDDAAKERRYQEWKARQK